MILMMVMDQNNESAKTLNAWTKGSILSLSCLGFPENRDRLGNSYKTQMA